MQVFFLSFLLSRHGGGVCVVVLVRVGTDTVQASWEPWVWRGFMFNEDAECGPGDEASFRAAKCCVLVLSFLYFARVFCGVWPLLLTFDFFVFFNSTSVRFCAAASVLLFPAFVCGEKKTLFSFMYFVYSLIRIK